MMMMMMNFKFNTNKSYRLVNKRVFCTTSPRYLDNGELMLAQHAPLTPIFVMGLLFISFSWRIGRWLADELLDSAVEAQHIVMYPDEMEQNFFFVPDFTMAVLVRYIFRLKQCVNY
jgi:hypothetical protein